LQIELTSSSGCCAQIEREIELGGSVTAAQGGGITNKVGGVDMTPSAGAGAAATPAFSISSASSVSEDGDGASTGSSADSALRKRASRSMLHRVAWNHSEFLVEYPSLAQELRVADQYLRIFLDSGVLCV
jgi:hypothetical protein